LLPRHHHSRDRFVFWYPGEFVVLTDEYALELMESHCCLPPLAAKNR